LRGVIARQKDDREVAGGSQEKGKREEDSRRAANKAESNLGKRRVKTAGLVKEKTWERQKKKRPIQKELEKRNDPDFGGGGTQRGKELCPRWLRESSCLWGRSSRGTELHGMAWWENVKKNWGML